MRWLCLMPMAWALLPAALPAQQTPVAEIRFIETILAEGMAVPSGTVPPERRCDGQARPAQRLCEAVFLLRQAQVPLVVPDQRDIAIERNRQWKPDEVRVRLPAEQEAVKRIRQVVNERPQWGVPYLLLAQSVLDDEGLATRADSARRLLTLAATREGVAPALLAITQIRAAEEHGATTDTWLQEAGRDTSTVGRAAWTHLLDRALPKPLAKSIAEVSGIHSTGWIEANAPVAEALTNVLRFDPTFRIRGTAYALQREQPVGVVAITFGQPQLMRDAVMENRVGYRLKATLLAVNASTGAVVRHDSLRNLSIPFGDPVVARCTVRGGAMADLDLMFLRTDAGTMCGSTPMGRSTVWLSLIAELPLPPGTWGIALTLTQDDGRRGATLVFDDLTIADPNSPALRLNGVVLGAPERSMTWPSASGAIPMNPSREWKAGAAVSVFTQIAGLQPEVAYRTQIDLEELAPPRRGDTPTRTTFHFDDQPPGRAAVEWTRSMQLPDKLRPGNYRVQLTITQGERQVVQQAEISVLRPDG